MSHAPTAAAMAATAAPPPPADSLAADLAELKQQIRDIDTQIKAETDMAREQQLRQEKVLHLQTLNLLREQQNLLLKHSRQMAMGQSSTHCCVVCRSIVQMLTDVCARRARFCCFT